MQKIKHSLFSLIPLAFILIVAVSCSKRNDSKTDDNPLAPRTKIEYSEKPVSVVNMENDSGEQRGQTPLEPENTVKPDLDLTRMSATMIYSTVFQFLIDWESYEGKVIKIRGDYTPFFRQETNRIYHNVVIQDATACCKEGLEFVWGDGSHAENEYPAPGTEIIVQGVFEQYYEDDKMEVMQIHLKDASMEIVQ